MVGGRRFLALLLVGVSALGACGDDGSEPEPERATVPTAESTTTSTAAPTTTTVPAADFEALPADPTLTPEQQVEAAYLHSWDIYLDALQHGRTEYLALVYVDPSLSSRREQVDDLVARGQKAIGDVADNRIQVTMLTETDAVLIDEYTNHLVLADAATSEPLEPDPNEAVVYSYNFVLQEGVWRIQYVERL